MSYNDTRASRTGTGLGIALAIGVTVGAVALLAPRLRDEMREDIFSAVPAASAPPVEAPARRAATPVPAASLAPGESVVTVPALLPVTALPPMAASTPAAPAPAPDAAKSETPASLPPNLPYARAQASNGKTHRALSRRPDRASPAQESRRAASEPRREVGSARATSEQPLRAYREREPLPPARREWREPRRESPWDIRTWREHRNPDVPGSSPLDRQPG